MIEELNDYTIHIHYVLCKSSCSMLIKDQNKCRFDRIRIIVSGYKVGPKFQFVGRRDAGGRDSTGG